jgi:RNA polymerase sigma-70 factor (family 1)
MKTPEQSDNELFTRVQAGNKDAFDAIFKRYYPALTAYACQYVSLEDAENTVQDVMLWFWENRERIKISSALNTYLFRAVKNQCLTLINRELIKKKVNEAIHKSLSDTFESPDFYMVNNLVDHLEAALEKLPKTYRQAFELNRFYNKKYKEIAEELSISPKTVDYRIQQALKLLRVALKEFLPFANCILYLH